MVRAIFFDFYSVWAPDRFAEYLAEAQRQDPAVATELQATIDDYYYGLNDITQVADTIRFKLNRQDIDPNSFVLQEADISPKLIEFMRGLHAHFLKLGVLANMGQQEYALLNSFNAHNQLFEVITGPIELKIPLFTQEAFAQALQAIGEPPRSTLVVSGHEDYRRFAESIGIASLKFEGFPKLRAAIDQILATDLP